MSPSRIPVATYRLQFNRRFRFEDARKLVRYLSLLGVSDIYTSPILKTQAGSQHGYDVTDPSQLNPELGTDAEFDALVSELGQNGMGILLDIVPNHMAASSENPWWMDLLENGRCSPYAAFFDIDWGPADSQGENRVLLPILGSPYKHELENQTFILSSGNTGLSVRYHDYRLPLDIKSYGLVFPHHPGTLDTALGASHPALRLLKQFLEAIERLPSCTGPGLTKISEKYRERQAIKEGLRHIIDTSPEVKALLLENIALFNGRKGETGSFDLLDKLLNQQVYRLAFWKTAGRKINYRRFFDINDLIGIRVEKAGVFEATHALILRLVREGKVSGLRVDHIDGLYDPRQYLSRLLRHISPAGKFAHFYIIVEKILSPDEPLPEDWPVSGTTGYDFLNVLNRLFVDSSGTAALDEIYHRFTGNKAKFDDVVYDKKKLVIAELFPGELHRLGKRLARLAPPGKAKSGLNADGLTRALVEISACLPVYRTYMRTTEVSPQDRLCLDRALREAGMHNPATEAGALEFLKRVLSLDFPQRFSSRRKKAWLRFVLLWQQLTGAFMAKGFEDTALYTYNRLVSLNEVGGDPGSSGLSVDELHRYNLSRLKRWPHTLNATTTHDTKRSEDVRARISVLSEIPGEWERRLTQWHQWNQPKKPVVKGLPVPEPNTEVLLYQTLVGAWPLSQNRLDGFKERLKAYMVKASREAKASTNWLSPNPGYESALAAFLDSILEISDQNDFLKDILQFVKKIAYYGALNALSQVLLKVTSPGVPDFYQGAELWDFSLVDPDNRRPVDFERRKILLDEIIKQEKQDKKMLIRRLLDSWEDGRVKLYVTCKALDARKSYRDVFREGQYIPVQVTGRRREHVCAFARRKDNAWALTVAPRLLTKLAGAGTPPLGRPVWGDDLLLLPEGFPKYWSNIFTGERLETSKIRKGLAISDIFCIFPIALLVNA